MKKYALLSSILLSVLLASCSKTLYYAWEGKEWGYCTLEVKKHQVIFRGTAPLFLQANPAVRYVFLYGNDPDKLRDNLKEDVFSIDINSFDTRYCVLENMQAYVETPRFNMGGFELSVDLFNEPTRRVSYVKGDNNSDTLGLVGIGRMKNKEYYFDYSYDYINVQDSVLLSKGIVWFPPEMHRVDKIDYKKFGEQLQHINLKEPWKGTKNKKLKDIWFDCIKD